MLPLFHAIFAISPPVLLYRHATPRCAIFITLPLPALLFSLSLIFAAITLMAIAAFAIIFADIFIDIADFSFDLFADTFSMPC
jgi:hypothetical protein